MSESPPKSQLSDRKAFSDREALASNFLATRIGSFKDGSTWPSVADQLTKDISRLTVSSRVLLLRACLIAEDIERSVLVLSSIDQIDLLLNNQEELFFHEYHFNSNLDNATRDMAIAVDVELKQAYEALKRWQDEVPDPQHVAEMIIEVIRQSRDIFSLKSAVCANVAVFIYRNGDIPLNEYAMNEIFRIFRAHMNMALAKAFMP
ncbi:MAG: hypothetical protein E5X49_17185 [Mesorhizobium sp.]|uniref:hypothetical protein n=1 Tax=Mesorhizobium sp. TaxID=1871066 RepID=UPI001208551A|nr:hypothetical protein [Mesorhizobium sp.]TIQ41869.1 MAG: hypothetical protein E5X49_17185 [Mesorhizobium sp.]